MCCWVWERERKEKEKRKARQREEREREMKGGREGRSEQTSPPRPVPPRAYLQPLPASERSSVEFSKDLSLCQQAPGLGSNSTSEEAFLSTAHQFSLCHSAEHSPYHSHSDSLLFSTAYNSSAGAGSRKPGRGQGKGGRPTEQGTTVSMLR